MSSGDELYVLPAMTCDQRHGSKGVGSQPDEGPPTLKPDVYFNLPPARRNGFCSVCQCTNHELYKMAKLLVWGRYQGQTTCPQVMSEDHTCADSSHLEVPRCARRTARGVSWVSTECLCDASTQRGHEIGVNKSFETKEEPKDNLL
ncbi:ATP-dependent zinc metalloprotease FtsH [Dorcoceras hygrometricum]|uniref:ATP-dependent zinc metalloprotease FtsH n=1 Tax=Dorcoceras hygrometricum TaxID=472368 RepID=A0A2Z7ABN4_9LAMI|nr:ATP-dependent zinc metalloprotease FtsH [Dorcoceras hygrometricum]